MKYNAFISYRHSELDMMVAKTIHKGLETFKVPRAIQKKTGKTAIKRVFRDQEELPIGSDLGDNIRQALENSEFLIVICSPRSKESYWVQKEIETFIELHGREHILAVLIEGEPDESFPEMILKDEDGNPVEPLAADLRESSSKKVKKKLKTELMRLAAPLLSCSYDDLRQRHRERRMRKMIAAVSLIAVAGVLFGIYSSYNAYMIQKNFREKQINESKFMAEKSSELLEYGDRRAAALLALEAMPGKNADRPYVASAELALSRALRCYDTGREIGMDRILKHNLPVSKFAFNSDGTMLASVDQGEAVYVWDISSGEQLSYVFPELEDEGGINRVKAVSVTNDGNLFIARENDISLQQLDGKILWKNQLPSSDEGNLNILYAVVNEEANLVACEGTQDLCFVDLSTAAIVDHVQNSLDYSFTSDMVFSADHKLVAIPHYVKDGSSENGYVSIYNLENKSIKSLKTKGNYIEEISFTDDGSVVLMSVDGRVFSPEFSDKEKLERIVECIDLNTEKVLWTEKMETNSLSFSGASSILRYRSYKDELLGETVFHVHMVADGEVRTVEAKTGKIVSRVYVGADIVSLKLAANGSLGFVTGTDGVVRICDLTRGEIYTDANIDSGKYVGDMDLYKGVMVLRERMSPDLCLMKYQEAEEMEKIVSFDSYVDSMTFSEKDSYYAIETSANEGNTIYFYKTDKDEMVAEWIPELNMSYDVGTFLDDKTYLVIGNKGTLGFYDLKKKKADYLQVGENIFPKYYITANKDFALLVTSHQYFVVDLEKKKVIHDGEMENIIHGFSLAEDGKKASFHFDTKGIIEVDLETDSSTEINLNDATVYTSYLDGLNMVYSLDGKYLACSCIDNILRLVDMETGMVVRELPFVGGNHAFIGFVEDTTEILMQGDDYYLRAYDIEEDELVYASLQQYPIIKELDKKDGKLALKTMSGMIVLNIEDYQLILDNSDVRLFSPEQRVVYCERNNVIYRFPYMNEEKLYQEVEKQFPGAKLTDEEKIRFNL